MAGHSIVILAGAAVAIAVAATVVFGALEGPSLAEKGLEVIMKLAFVAAMAGWLVMWLTQEEIWSSAPRACPALASILLKGRVYQNCSYLVHRYEVGQWPFPAGLGVGVIAFAIRQRLRQQR